MVYKNGYAIPDAARHNQIDRRLNGVIDFDPATHVEDTGPCNVTPGSSSSAVESDVDAGTVQIDGDPVEVDLQSVPHEPGHEEYDRHDIVWIASDGSANVLTGEPGSNAMYTPDGNIIYPEGPNAPNPQTQDTRRLEGTVLASVWVPQQATDTGPLSLEAHYHDRRRPAMPLPREPQQTLTLGTNTQPIQEGEWVSDAFLVPGGHTLQLWEYQQIANFNQWDSSWGVRVQLVRADGGDITTGSNVDIFLTQSTSYELGDPITSVSIPTGVEHRRFELRQRNYNFDMASVTGGQVSPGFSCKASVTIDPTDAV